jgi:hypothetical protein
MLNSIQSCARKTEYSFIKKLQPLEKADALEKGDLMHKMFEVYYSLKLTSPNFHSEVWRELISQQITPDLKDPASEAGRYFSTKMNLSVELAEEVIYQFQEYSKYYQFDAWAPLAVEEVGSRVLYEDDDLQIIYTFKIDLVAEKGNIIAPFDHKTSARTKEPSSLSNQFIGYCFGLRTNTIVINKVGFQKTLEPSKRFMRYVLTIDDERIEEWRANSIYWARLYDRYLVNDHFPMNLTSCDKYGGCIFARICESNPHTREWKLERDFEAGRLWDPAKELEAK